MKSIVITGASSGIGKATAIHFAQQGWKVAATMRTPEKEADLTDVENISIYQLDVTDQASIDTASAQIIADFGTVDVVLNNAGYGLMGAFEAATPDQIRHQFDVNVFGLMEVTRAFIPHFRANQAGLFLNVSSIGGKITFPLISLYHSTKWAVEGFSESLSYELGELGIGVKLIQPGGVSTDFGGRSMTFAMNPELTEYNEMTGKVQAMFGDESRQALYSSAEQIAQGIYDATTDGTSQLRYLLGADAVQMAQMRDQAGDDGFVAGMRQQIFG